MESFESDGVDVATFEAMPGAVFEAFTTDAFEVDSVNVTMDGFNLEPFLFSAVLIFPVTVSVLI